MTQYTKLRQSGFTIVELLIVVVIIAILAAITIVAYNGIQNRAKASAAQSAANSAIKKAEAYNADNTAPTNGYPQSGAQMTGAASTTLYRLDGITFVATPGAAGTTPSSLRYTACGHNGTATAPATAAAMTTVVGSRIDYYDYGTSSIKTLTAGITTTGGNPNVACIVSN
jgi:type IV pilus assembly protein PilA